MKQRKIKTEEEISEYKRMKILSDKPFLITVAVGVISMLGLAAANLGIFSPKEYDVSVRGRVVSEIYMPAIGRDFVNSQEDSRYSFSIETNQGRKAFQVTKTDKINVESIDALIELGDMVEIGVDIGKGEKTVYEVPADRIKKSRY